MKLYYDLHLHSCLSPCGDNDMTPLQPCPHGGVTGDADDCADGS